MEEYQELYELVTKRLCQTLEMPEPRFFSFTLSERVREIVVQKLCKLMGVECFINYQNNTFYFFSMFVGQLLVNRLGYKIKVMPKGLQFLCCKGKNLLREVDMIFDNYPPNEALINSFLFLDEFREEVNRLKLNKYCA